MLSGLLAPALARRGVFYGWVVVAATFLTMLATAAAMGMTGVLLLPLQQEFGWTTGDISGPLAFRILLFGLMAPFSAALLQRYGMRWTVAAAMLLIGTGLLLAMTVMTTLAELWLYWGVLVGLGTGMTAMVLGATVANRWFVARRGLVMGFLTASSATGQLAFLPAAAWMAEHWGWRATTLASMLVCAVAAVVTVMLAAERPHSVGQVAYGEAPGTKPPPAPSGNAVAMAFATLAEAAGNRMFWVLFLTFFVCGLSTNGLIQTHFISLCFDFGMPNVQAASVLALMGVFDFVGTILSGWLSDRFNNRWLLFWYYGLRGLSLLLLPMSTFTFYGLSIFAVFYGLDWIATVPPTVKLAAAEFGREKAGLVFGWVFTAHQLGAAVAAFGAGLSRDLLASYLPAFYLAGAACLVAAVLVVAVRRQGTRAVAVAQGAD
ncbi:MFS transporter [Roseomonas sp. NAR14]|uniref:MFS transporter n=1 Tax=Roseomonas acroporae TaxID=2937791 RepID=A0A9X1YCT4_9PROT|nr:MFS transporter [Roseomonas acroporae]MCK8787788.1 MFS transporter [Roseomonas acroporae]